MESLFEEDILTTTPSTENCSTISRRIIIVLYLTMCGLGALANMAFCISISCWSKSRPRNSLLLSVIVADIFVCLVSGSLTASFYTKWPAWIKTLPTLAAFLQDAPISLSTWSMMVLAVDRYLTVRNHRNFSPFSGKSYINHVIGVTWLIAIIISCVHFVPEKLQKALIIVHVILVYLMPSCIIVITHAAVHTRLTALSLTARAQHGELPLPMPLLRRPTHVIIVAGISKPGSSSRPQTPQHIIVEEEPRGPNETSSLQSRKKLANALLWGAILFVVCWIPHVVAQLHNEFSAEDWPTLSFFGFFAGHLHSVINPISYYFFHRSLGNSDSNKNRWFFQKWGIKRSASSTNEAQLGPFNPRFTQFAAKRQYRRRPSSTNVFF